MSSTPGPPIGVVIVGPAIPLPSPLSRASAAPVTQRSSPHPAILESREAAFPSVVLMAVTDTGRVTSSTFPSQSLATSSSPRSGASAALAASFRSPILHTPRRRWEQDKQCDIACVTYNARMMHQWYAGTSPSHLIACDHMRSNEIACDRMRSHEIACDCMQSHEIANLMSTTVRVLENALGTRSGTERLPKCFFTTTVNRFHIIFFAFLKKEEMRSGTYFTQQNVFLLFTVVVTKHV